MNENSLNYYQNKAKLLELKNPKKIALLSNFTLDGLCPVIQVKSFEHNMHVKYYESSYNQFKQEIFDLDSNWYKFEPDLTFLILDFESYLGKNLFDFYSWTEEKRHDYSLELVNEFEQLIQYCLSNSTGKIFLSNFQIPLFSPFGILDTKIPNTLTDLVNSLNSKLYQLVKKHNSLFCINMNIFFQKYGISNTQDPKWKFLADMKITPSYIPILGEYLISYIKPMFGLSKKCLVLDLDNTLWGGIIGEDGINNIKLDEKPPGNTFLEFQRIVKQFYDRGIILAINSKNNFSDVKEVFIQHPKMILTLENFASYQINWNDKASNMKKISEDLNIGLDSLVFWDDDPLNRELIKQTFPEVFVVDVPKDPSLYSEILKNLDVFNTYSYTKEDFQKGQIYAEQNKRKQEAENFHNIDDFLSSLNMKISIEKANDFTIPRISQLTMKTNQFNLTTKRYSEENIQKMSKNPNFLIKTFSVSDKFGDNGLTGLYIIEKISDVEWNVDTFLMSCRIMGRKIEEIMLYDLLTECKNNNISKLTGTYLPTNKNSITHNLYLNHGFLKIDENTFILKSFDKTIFSIPNVKIINSS